MSPLKEELMSSVESNVNSPQALRYEASYEHLKMARRGLLRN
jgi:hypothetical protein